MIWWKRSRRSTVNIGKVCKGEADLGSRGRYGKYGEVKRFDRLRKAGIRGRSPIGSVPGSDRFRRSLKEGFRKRGAHRVRPAKRADLTFIGLISEKIFRPYGPYGEIISQWFTSGATMTRVADAGPDPVGFVMLRHGARIGSSDASEIMAIGVEPAWQQRGIGVMLMREIEGEAKRAGINILFLHTAEDNLPAQKLFTKMGFSPLKGKKRFYPEGQDAVLMFKRI